MSDDAVRSQTLTSRAIHQQLEAIWKEVLELEAVPDDARFLDLGGDSVLAMLCISRMRTRLKVELSIESFLTKDSTLAGFARVIEEMSAAGSDR